MPIQPISPLSSFAVSADPRTAASTSGSSASTNSGSVSQPQAITLAGLNSAAATYRQKSNHMYLASMFGLSAKPAYTAESARKAASEGTPVHAFFYQDIDALAQMASDPEQTLDTSFAEDTLDFFTGGNYTKQDVDSLHKQMTTALQELSQQLADTGRVNASQLNSRMTINGTEVSLGDLADFQMMGQRLTPAFSGITSNSSRLDDMQSMAKMAVARLFGRVYGRDKGELGAMFTSAIDRLYDNGVNKINQFYADSSDGVSGTLYNGSEIRDKVSGMFSQLDTTNKDTLAYDFNQKLSAMQSIMNQQYSQFGIPASYRNAHTAARNIGQFFSAAYQLL